MPIHVVNIHEGVQELLPMPHKGTCPTDMFLRAVPGRGHWVIHGLADFDYLYINNFNGID